MKKIAAVLLVFICIITIFIMGCSKSEVKQPEETISFSEISTSPSGYITSKDMSCEIVGYLTYEVIDYDGEYLSVIDEAETLVKAWWNDDATFHRPEIIWVNIIEGDCRGFQDTGYLFLDPNTTREDLLATTVHEWIHELVPLTTLIDTKRGGWGRAIMEMIVESITVDILGKKNVKFTENYLYFKNCSELWNKKDALEKAYKEGRDYSAYEEILGNNYEEIIKKAEISMNM